MKKKIYIADLVHNTLPGNYSVPLNAASLAAYLSTQGTPPPVTLFKYTADLLDAVKQASPAVVGLSMYEWNWNLSVSVAKRIKQLSPATHISVGGPSIENDLTFLTNFLTKNPAIDSAIVFEGEMAFANIVKDITSPSNQLNTLHPGVAFLRHGNLCYRPPQLFDDLSHLPSPYLAGYLDSFLDQGLIPLFESNRGCPYSCSYCAWGISFLNQTRKFPMERILAEIDYVGTKFPTLPTYILADGNFGIFKRDIQIAKALRSIKDVNPILQRIVFWSSKNNAETNYEIVKLLGEGERVLLAVQSLDPVVQENIGRRNIQQDDLKDYLSTYKKKHIQVGTDLIGGLPGETYANHLKTLEKCFELGFDVIGDRTLLFLPGTQLNLEEERKKYQYQTSFRLKSGCYGEYQGIKVVECEEVASGSKDMSPNEFKSMRLLQCLVGFCWNSGHLKPFLSNLHHTNKINPIHVLNSLVEKITELKGTETRLGHFARDIINSLDTELHPSRDALIKKHTKEPHWGRLLSGGFSKLYFKVVSRLLYDRKLLLDFLSLIFSATEELSSQKVSPAFQKVTENSFIDPLTVYNKLPGCTHKILPFPHPSNFKTTELEYLRPFLDLENRSTITLYKDEKVCSAVRALLKKYEFEKNPQYAVEKVLETYQNAFCFELKACD
ncbi:B12-binding domain-containing radical SAM protein [Pseudodesulfovibrio piezophilus]|uniref:Uncharacterized protein n=1 Tax=Pseudodesulfovibrio piezophilus (strain DSM 21447 / JCM 15486 / C1TLV30) TaxID=1322246 RepID=M1WS31_PSEP2|nr:B12-binding domain-containing radical SAM protein [Pseudodesulfovibrio piezophilus]CCH49929.1 protein of unknown function [Pseudodesulfovibrio piezophilus C1TLV30]